MLLSMLFKGFIRGMFLLSYIYCGVFVPQVIILSAEAPGKTKAQNIKSQVQPGKHSSDCSCSLSFSTHLGFLSLGKTHFYKGKETHIFLGNEHVTCRFSFSNIFWILLHVRVISTHPCELWSSALHLVSVRPPQTFPLLTARNLLVLRAQKGTKVPLI
jgi:hypothetical protein